MPSRAENMLNRDFLVRNLCFLQRLIVASAPLLEFAIPRTMRPLRDYYERHANEEQGHEVMLAKDLARLGVEEIPFCHTAAAIAGSQYYFLAHDHPALLLGYMLALESQPMSLEEIQQVEAEHSVSLYSLRHHAIHDVAHRKDLVGVMEAQSISVQARVSWNARCVMQMLLSVAHKLATNQEIV